MGVLMKIGGSDKVTTPPPPSAEMGKISVTATLDPTVLERWLDVHLSNLQSPIDSLIE